MPAARLEIIAAHDGHENKAHSLGRRFQDEVDFQVSGIATHRLLLENVRRARPRRFPMVYSFDRCKIPSMSSPAFTQSLFDQIHKGKAQS